MVGSFDLFIGVGEHLDRFRSPISPKIGFPGRGYLIEQMQRISDREVVVTLAAPGAASPPAN